MAEAIATDVVRRGFPDVRAAWLGGSAASDTMTAASDLDVTVLMDGRALDAESGTDHAGSLLRGLAEVNRANLGPMRQAVETVLATFGGRLFDGYRRSGTGA